MGDKPKTFAVPSSKNVKPKRPSTVSVASTSRSRANLNKERASATSQSTRFNKNTTALGDGDFNNTILKEGSMPDFDDEYRQIAYGKFLRAMLEDCLVDEKIEREETHIDIQMGQLADRFKKTMDMLDKTNQRLKDISFVVEQKKLLDLKSLDCSQFYEMTENSNAEELVKDLLVTEQASLDRLELKNVDFGYDKNSGHKQLLDAVNDALEGLDEIKKHSNLDLDKFNEYQRSEVNLNDIQKDRFDLDSLKSDFEAKFPKFSEKLLKEVSEHISNVINDDD